MQKNKKRLPRIDFSRLFNRMKTYIIKDAEFRGVVIKIGLKRVTILVEVGRGTVKLTINKSSIIAVK